MKYLLTSGLVLCLFACTPPASRETSDFQTFIDNFDPSAGRTSNDLDADSYLDELAWFDRQLAILEQFDTSRMTFEENIDWQFAYSILKGRKIRQSHNQRWKMDPRIYMRFRTIANIIGEPGDPNDKLDRLKEKLDLVPLQLANGERQLEIYVPRFQELSLFMANNAIVLFENEIPSFNAGLEKSYELDDMVSKAREALGSFIDFLENELPTKPEGDFAMGKNTYNQMLSDEFLLDYSDETLWEFGKVQFAITVTELETLAREIDNKKTWQELAIEIKNEFPDPYDMIAAHQLWVDSAKSHILNNNLIPIPWNEQVRVVPRAQYLRKTSYYGNFSRARGKDEDSIYTARWMINPFEDRWDTQTKQEYLVEHDWGVIIVTAPHEAYGGHHVQGLYQMHNPRKIRRENGLSLFSEGWGLYNEQLMSETGFFPNKRIHLRQLQLRLWRNARVIYDVGIHTGKMSYEDAISLMTDEVGFLRWAAQLEIDAASARPGYFIGYFIGMKEIMKMREQYQQKMGNDFTLSDFHKNILEIGNMPPKLMAKVLLSD